MRKERIIAHKTEFDSIAKTEGGVLFWSARELMPRLGYERWENFETAIGRAIESCKTASVNTSDHFRKATKMVIIGSNTKREIPDYF